MAKDFLGRGWPFPILPDELGAIGYIEAEDNVEQSLRVLLLTAAGERVMRPSFGTQAPTLVFAPGSTQNLHLLETTIRDAVIAWEPRVELDTVSAEMDPSETPGSEVRAIVSIRYRVRQTNTANNLVFPFYLGQTGVG